MGTSRDLELLTAERDRARGVAEGGVGRDLLAGDARFAVLFSHRAGRGDKGGPGSGSLPEDACQIPGHPVRGRQQIADALDDGLHRSKRFRCWSIGDISSQRCILQGYNIAPWIFGCVGMTVKYVPGLSNKGGVLPYRGSLCSVLFS
jgi:hypothetical protein